MKVQRQSVRFVILKQWSRHFRKALRRGDVVTANWLSALFDEICEENTTCKS